MELKKYKLRAECLDDLIKLDEKQKNLQFVDIDFKEGFPDCELTFKSELRIDELKHILMTIEDGHVMVETLQLEENYTGERI